MNTSACICAPRLPGLLRHAPGRLELHHRCGYVATHELERPETVVRERLDPPGPGVAPLQERHGLGEESFGRLEVAVAGGQVALEQRHGTEPIRVLRQRHGIRPDLGQQLLHPFVVTQVERRVRGGQHQLTVTRGSCLRTHLHRGVHQVHDLVAAPVQPQRDDQLGRDGRACTVLARDDPLPRSAQVGPDQAELGPPARLIPRSDPGHERRDLPDHPRAARALSAVARPAGVQLLGGVRPDGVEGPEPGFARCRRRVRPGCSPPARPRPRARHAPRAGRPARRR